MELSGHRVLVTGGTSGIGRALAQALHARGARVALCGRDAERLLAAAQEMPGVEAIRCDLATPGDRAMVVAETVRRLGGLSLLVNNAGVQYRHAYLTDDPSQILAETADEIAVNLTALVALTVLALPHLRQASQAAIVNISSVLALSPKKTAPVYCATKAAVSSFSRALRYQLEEEAPHVGVLDVLPPMVETAMTAGRGRLEDKLMPGEVAEATCRALEAGRTELPLGRARVVRWLMRLAPGVVERRFRNT